MPALSVKKLPGRFGAEIEGLDLRQPLDRDTAKELTDAHGDLSGGRCTGMACDIRVSEAIHDSMDEIWAGGPLSSPR